MTAARGLTNEVSAAKSTEWSEQLANELHKPIKRHFKKRKVYVKNIDEIWAADLVDMQHFAEHNDGYKYLLSVIDVFSKYGWMIPLKQKTGKEVSSAFEKIMKESGRKPEKVWCDKGTEFYNQNVKKLFELYSTENEEKSCVVERFNRTIKTRMFKFFTANNARRYIDVIEKIVEQYNNSKHSTVKMSPINASKKENESIVFHRLNSTPQIRLDLKPKFSIGDKVRISKKKRTFEKGYFPNWTEELFTISTVQHTDPITYKIVDTKNEEVKGTFYEPELQKSSQEVYQFEKIVQKKRKKYLVKWLGYPESFNSWVNEKDLMLI